MLYRVHAALAYISVPLVLSTALYLLALSVLLFLVAHFICKKRPPLVYPAEDKLSTEDYEPITEHPQSFENTKRPKPLVSPRRRGKDTLETEFRTTEFDYFKIREHFEKMSLESPDDDSTRFPSPPPSLTVEDEEEYYNNFKTIECDLDLEKSGKLKGERMFELRRIQFGDRAVSSGETAQQLEQFFTRDQDRTVRPPRQENVRNELEELGRIRSVGNLLNTRFRTLLENSLSAPPQIVPLRTQPSRAQPSSARAAPPPAPPAPPAPAAPTGVRLAREAATGDPAARQQVIEEAENYVPPEDNRQFDYAISDVEELFQRRLVSDVLHSTFRNVLELHIERRLVRQGVAPAAAQRHTPRQPAQQQPSTSGGPAPPWVGGPAPQWGLPGPALSIPAIVSGSRRLPEMERQMHTLTNDMTEMKGTMRLLADTMLDVQRSIRQEVNAMITKSTGVPAKATRPLKEGTCVVCLERSCDTVLYRCGHLCCCFSCARELRVAGHHCPVCRAEVADILRVYRSSSDY